MASAVQLTSDLDIYRTANVLVKHYGEDAGLEAVEVPGQAEAVRSWSSWS